MRRGFLCAWAVACPSSLLDRLTRGRPPETLPFSLLCRADHAGTDSEADVRLCLVTTVEGHSGVGLDQIPGRRDRAPAR